MLHYMLLRAASKGFCLLIVFKRSFNGADLFILMAADRTLENSFQTTHKLGWPHERWLVDDFSNWKVDFYE